MGIDIETSGKATLAEISGELDHHTAKFIRTEIDREINLKKPEILVVDFSGVTFMDSSGIGLVMGRYKLMQETGGKVVISRPPDYIRKVMKLAGVDRLVTFCENPRRLMEKEQKNVSKETDSYSEKEESEKGDEYEKVEAKTN